MYHNFMEWLSKQLSKLILIAFVGSLTIVFISIMKLDLLSATLGLIFFVCALYANKVTKK